MCGNCKFHQNPSDVMRIEPRYSLQRDGRDEVNPVALCAEARTEHQPFCTVHIAAPRRAAKRYAKPLEAIEGRAA